MAPALSNGAVAVPSQELVEKALQESREKQDQRGEVQALEELLKVHLAQGYLSQAIQDAKEAAGVYVALGDALGQVKAWHLAAQLALRQGSPFDKAVACAEAARSAQSTIHDASIEDQVLVLQTLSAAHLANGTAKEALAAASRARELCQDQEDEELLRCEAVSLLRISGAQAKLGDLEAALSAASDAQELFREYGDPLAEAGVCGLVARLQRERRDLSGARLAADTARAVLRQTGELAREVGALLLSSQVASLELAAGAQPGGGAAAREFYEGKGRNKVMAKAKEAVSLSKRLSGENLMAIAQLAEARAKVSNGLLEEAMTELKDLLPVLVDCGDRRAVGAAKLLQANISVLLGTPDVAVAKEALDCFKDAGAPPHDMALAQSLITRLQQTRAPVPRAGPAPDAGPRSAAVPAAASGPTVPKPAVIDKMTLPLPERVKYTLTELVAEATNIEHMEEDRALMETGMTSIASIMLRDRIQAEFPEIPEMDLTFVFDYPTIRDMTGFVLTALPDA